MIALIPPPSTFRTAHAARAAIAISLCLSTLAGGFSHAQNNNSPLRPPIRVPGTLPPAQPPLPAPVAQPPLPNPPPPVPSSGQGNKTMPCLIKNINHVVGAYVSVRCLAAHEGIHTLKMPMTKPGIALFVAGLSSAALDSKTITLVYSDKPDSAGGVAACSAATGCAELVGTK